MIDRNRMHTLKEINLDSARHRWVRDNLERVKLWAYFDLTPDMFDEMVDEELAKENP